MLVTIAVIKSKSKKHLMLVEFQNKVTVEQHRNTQVMLKVVCLTQ